MCIGSKKVSQIMEPETRDSKFVLVFIQTIEKSGRISFENLSILPDLFHKMVRNIYFSSPGSSFCLFDDPIIVYIFKLNYKLKKEYLFSII